jgi:hypothetical protein
MKTPRHDDRDTHRGTRNVEPKIAGKPNCSQNRLFLQNKVTSQPTVSLVAGSRPAPWLPHSSVRFRKIGVKDAPVALGRRKRTRPGFGRTRLRVEHRFAARAEISFFPAEASNDEIDIWNFGAAQAENIRRARHPLFFGAQCKASGRIQREH